MSRQIENTLGAIAQQANETARPLVNNIFGVSAEFLGELKTWLEQNPPAIPVTQIVGFSQFTAQFATARNSSTVDTSVSVTYTTLTNPGPTLTGLPDGKYILFFGGRCKNSVAGSSTCMAPSVNGAAASDDDFAATEVDVFTEVVRVLPATLNNDGNSTIEMNYRVAGNTGSWAETWLIALRYSNL